MLHFLTKLLEQGVGHAFLFPQESLKKVREKFDGGVALMSTRPLADWIASHKASYSPASKKPLVRKRLYLYCVREMPNFSQMRTMNLYPTYNISFQRYFQGYAITTQRGEEDVTKNTEKCSKWKNNKKGWNFVWLIHMEYIGIYSRS